jgi:hypothetical protein
MKYVSITVAAKPGNPQTNNGPESKKLSKTVKR